MKRFALLLGVVAGLVALPAFASPGSFVLASPDRPAIWYNRAGDKVSQSLNWNEGRKELSAHVAYNQLESMPLRDQFYYDTFRLSFPSVRLDPRTRRLYFVDRRGHRTEFGAVTSGPFGRAVHLDRNVTFMVFRGEGTVHAVISSRPDGQPPLARDD